MKKVVPKIKDDIAIIETENANPNRPAYFVLSRTSGYYTDEERLYHPNRPWLESEYWSGGHLTRKLNRAEAATVQNDALREIRTRFGSEWTPQPIPRQKRIANTGGYAGKLPWRNR